MYTGFRYILLCHRPTESKVSGTAIMHRKQDFWRRKTDWVIKTGDASHKLFFKVLNPSLAESVIRLNGE